MPDLFIITDSAVVPIAEAMQQAVLREQNKAIAGDLGHAIEPKPSSVQVVTSKDLADAAIAAQLMAEKALICPLTFEVPDWLSFPAQLVFEHCRGVEALRQQVASWPVAVADGALWLPIVLTAKGPVYGEAIARVDSGYQQPVHLTDAQRQPLYALAQRLVRSLNAPPAVYLLQFGCAERDIWFDRLIPFPAEPAIASLGVQTPDLFTCHWRCLTHQPILDLIS